MRWAQAPLVADAEEPNGVAFPAFEGTPSVGPKALAMPCLGTSSSPRSQPSTGSRLGRILCCLSRPMPSHLEADWPWTL
jgi:hypothetical protein